MTFKVKYVTPDEIRPGSILQYRVPVPRGWEVHLEVVGNASVPALVHVWRKDSVFGGKKMRIVFHTYRDGASDKPWHWSVRQRKEALVEGFAESLEDAVREAEAA